jgi:hypothetical protein
VEWDGKHLLAQQLVILSTLISHSRTAGSSFPLATRCRDLAQVRPAMELVSPGLPLIVEQNLPVARSRARIGGRA